MIKSDFHTYQNLSLEYYKFGSGTIPLLAFHGFGRHAKDFEAFVSTFGKKYTIYAFNLFHHGASKYPDHRIEKDTLTKDEFKLLFSSFLDKKPFNKTAIMGYSLGGKIALMFTEIFPEQVESLWLFAPDGVKMNPWYFIASKTQVGRSIYKYFLHQPQLFFFMVNSLHNTKLINDKIKKFALKNMDSKEKRELVYKVWLTFKDTNPNIKLCVRNILKNKIPVYQFYGKNDKVIPPTIGQKFSKRLKQEQNFHMLQSGHQLITDKTSKYIAELRIIK
ncbi:alpha/beta hydrolase [bacterium SCSIO 12643]|nr:alpha/beta hydrolase [bacterium SCSIO 12643]